MPKAEPSKLVSAFLVRVDAFLEEAEIEQGPLSERLFGEWRKIAGLREGRDVETRTLEAAEERLAKIRAHWRSTRSLPAVRRASAADASEA